MKKAILISLIFLAVPACPSWSRQKEQSRTVDKVIGESDGRLLEISECRTLHLSRPEGCTFKLLPPDTSKCELVSKDGKDLYFRDSLILKGGNGIVYGTAVSRNEFGCDEGIFPGPVVNGSRKYAFYRKDESNVTLHGEERYPMTGTSSEILKIGIFDPETFKVRYLHITDFSPERYLTCISWGGQNFIYVQVLDREQHNMHLNMYSAADGTFVKTILEEQSDKWVEPYEPLHFFNDYLFIYSTDNRDGYKNLYLCDVSGKTRRIVKTDADIEYAGIHGDFLYYTSHQDSPAASQLYRVEITQRQSAAKTRIGKPERLTCEDGWHNITFGADGFIDDYRGIDNPGYVALKDFDGSTKTRYDRKNPLDSILACRMEFGTVLSADGKFRNNYRLTYPAGFDPSRKYPLIVYVYGGPHMQLVNDSWRGNLRMWEMYMAQRGYAVYVQDNRGTPNHGTDYEKAINRNCGRAEMEDQMAGLSTLLSEPWVDTSRIGVHGWSYGGFMTLSLATTYPDVFKVAVCGGPVIDWKWYEVMYGERYMDTPGTNPEGYGSTSLIAKAKDLKARTLIFHGMKDSTVLPLNTMNFIQKCIDNDIPVEFFPFPNAAHNMTGKERDYLYKKISEYFENNL